VKNVKQGAKITQKPMFKHSLFTKYLLFAAALVVANLVLIKIWQLFALVILLGGFSIGFSITLCLWSWKHQQIKAAAGRFIPPPKANLFIRVGYIILVLGMLPGLGMDILVILANGLMPSSQANEVILSYINFNFDILLIFFICQMLFKSRQSEIFGQSNQALRILGLPLIPLTVSIGLKALLDLSLWFKAYVILLNLI